MRATNKSTSRIHNMRFATPNIPQMIWLPSAFASDSQDPATWHSTIVVHNTIGMLRSSVELPDGFFLPQRQLCKVKLFQVGLPLIDQRRAKRKERFLLLVELKCTFAEKAVGSRRQNYLSVLFSLAFNSKHCKAQTCWMHCFALDSLKALAKP